jgi:hypothetical protein
VKLLAANSISGEAAPGATWRAGAIVVQRVTQQCTNSRDLPWLLSLHCRIQQIILSCPHHNPIRFHAAAQPLSQRQVQCLHIVMAHPRLCHSIHLLNLPFPSATHPLRQTHLQYMYRIMAQHLLHINLPLLWQLRLATGKATTPMVA